MPLPITQPQQMPTATQVPNLQGTQSIPPQVTTPSIGTPDYATQQATANPTATHQTYVNDKIGREVTIFSSTGDLQPIVNFDKAFSNFDNGGKQTPGFIAMDAGVMSQLRKGFEAVNQPIQQAVKSMDDPNARVNMLPSMLQGPAKALLRIPSEMTKTPEDAAGSLATAVATAATGSVSLPIQMLAVGLGTTATRLLAGYSFGSGPDVGKAVIQGTAAAVTQGAQGFIAQVLGQGMSQKAGNDTAKGILDLIKRENPALANDPNAINAYMSSASNLSKVVQRGMQGVREDVQQISQNLVPNVVGGVGDALVYNVNQSSARSLTTAAQATLRAQGREYYRLTNTLLDNIDNPQKYTDAKDAINALFIKMANTVKDSMKGQSQTVIDKSVQALDNALVQQNTLMNRSIATAQLFAALKRSNAETGWNVQAFQQEVQGYYQSLASGHMVEEAGNIAGRGAPLTEGTDRTFINAHKLPSWLGGYETPAMGKHFIGHVRDAPVAVMGNVGGAYALESFIGKGREYISKRGDSGNSKGQ